MTTTKYNYVLLSLLSDKALDVASSNTDPGSRVTIWSKNSNENQQWWNDATTGTIRTMLNDYCLELVGDTNLCINPYVAGNVNQQWQLTTEGYVKNTSTGNVLEIIGSNKNDGVPMQAAVPTGELNQMWRPSWITPPPGEKKDEDKTEPDGTNPDGTNPDGTNPDGTNPDGTNPDGTNPDGTNPDGTNPDGTNPDGTNPDGTNPNPDGTKKAMRIKSAKDGRVLDVGDGTIGSRIGVKAVDSSAPVSQQWYVGSDGFIRSMLNDLAIDAAPNKLGEIGAYTGTANQQWTIAGKYIKNASTGEYLDLYTDSSHGGTEAGSYRFNEGAINQEWSFEYL